LADENEAERHRAVVWWDQGTVVCACVVCAVWVALPGARAEGLWYL
jgi:hypothetical protein